MESRDIPIHLKVFAWLLARTCAFVALASSPFIIVSGIEYQALSQDATATIHLFTGFALLILGTLTAIQTYQRCLYPSTMCVQSIAMTFMALWTWPGAIGLSFYPMACAFWLVLRYRGCSQLFRQKFGEFHPVSSLSSKQVVSKSQKIFGFTNFSNRPRAICESRISLLLLIGMNALLFSLKWNDYRHINLALALARASAATVNLNVALMPLPTLHRLWANFFVSIPKRFRPVHTKDIHLHRTLAYFLMVGSSFHVQGHLAYITTRHGSSYLVGAWISGLFLTPILTIIFLWSLSKAPRRSFNRLHIFGGILGSTILFVHGPTTMAWCAPALILTLIERLLAARPTTNRVSIVGSTKYGECILHLVIAGKFELKGGEYIYLSIPSLSATEWRPFSVIPETGQDRASVFIRIRPEIAAWTNRMVRHVHQERFISVAANVDGPHPSPACQHTKYSNIILIATGIGCTPVISILRSIRIRSKISARHGKQVSLVVAWVLPLSQVENFSWMLRDIVEICKWSKGKELFFKLRVHIYVTGCVPGYDHVSVESLSAKAIWESYEELKQAVQNPVAPSLLQNASFRPRPWMQIEVWRGRPFFASLLVAQRQELRDAGGSTQSVGVFCCGPPAFVKDIRGAIASVSKPASPLIEKDDSPSSAEEYVDRVADSVHFVLHPEIF